MSPVGLGGVGQSEFLVLSEHLHVQVAVLLDPVLVDLHGEGSYKTQATVLIREDPDDERSALYLLVDALKHVRTSKMLVMLHGPAIVSERLFDVLFNPAGNRRTTAT